MISALGAVLAVTAALPPAAVAADDPLAPGRMPAVDVRPESYPADVWVTGSMAKVRRTDPPGHVRYDC
jgi:hypothetical protein